MDQRLPRNEIIRRKQTFNDIFSKGIRIEGSFIRCIFLPEESSGKSRPTLFGVKVSRATKRAVDRNLIKRTVREAFRKNKNMIANEDGSRTRIKSILFICSHRVDAAKSKADSIRTDVINLLNRIKSLYL